MKVIYIYSSSIQTSSQVVNINMIKFELISFELSYLTQHFEVIIAGIELSFLFETSRQRL